jgi:hypothetical protein
MKNQEEKYGECRICGRMGKLSYEHVPTGAAFNQNKAFMYFGKDVIGAENFPWDFSNIKGRQLQKGIGFNTLCIKCNNNTGHLYGNAFVEFIYQGYRQTYNKAYRSGDIVNVEFRDIYPLRIIKQIVTMFFSVNPPGLSKIHPELVKFVLDKWCRELSLDKFGFYVFVLRGSILRYIGITGILNSDGSTRILSEISAPPFGYVFEIEPKGKANYCDLTSFGNNYKYDDKVTIRIDVPVLEVNSYFPADYRTKWEIMETYIRNKLNKSR